MIDRPDKPKDDCKALVERADSNDVIGIMQMYIQAIIKMKKGDYKQHNCYQQKQVVGPGN